MEKVPANPIKQSPAPLIVFKKIFELLRMLTLSSEKEPESDEKIHTLPSTMALTIVMIERDNNIEITIHGRWITK